MKNIYWFGQDRENWMEESAWSDLEQAQKKLYETSLDDILTLLDQFSHFWKEGSTEFEKIAYHLESSFEREELKKTIHLLSHLLSRQSLEKRIEAELTNKNVLDRFTKLAFGTAKVRAIPRGVTLHVTAGNVFLSSIDSLVMGLITKNLSILKVSHQNKFFPIYFAEKLKEFDVKNILADKFAIVYWKGGDQKIESAIKKKVKTIIAWGGEEMVDSYRHDLPLGVKLLDFGPKVSIQVLSQNGIKNKNLGQIAKNIVTEVIAWNQQACASPQNLYVQKGIDVKDLMEKLNVAFEEAAPRGPIDADEAVEILKEKYRATYSKLMQAGEMKIGEDFLLHFEQNSFLRPSPLNRSLLLKFYQDADDLFHLLSPFSFYLQSCSYLFDKNEKEKYLNLIALAGMKRFAPLGTIMMGMDGAPHDGRFVLRELVQFIGDEDRIQNDGEDLNAITTSSDLQRQFAEKPHPPGYIFSSGGTTGTPKFVHYSYEEFDFVTEMIATNFKAQGLRAGMTVANLFVAGNLWSSFIAVEKALEKIGVIQLPIGGLCAPESIVMYLQKFKPQVVVGIPSLLINIAELSSDLKVEKVFYAGEALSITRREFLKKTWDVKYFGSAGYASVDAGIIGYQCEHCDIGVHHLFSDQVEMQIINEEAVVTSGYRTSLEIKNYRTGDRVEWVEGNCLCGRGEKRFKLMGRIDNTIQIWSSRLLFGEIEKSIREIDPTVMTYQVVLENSSHHEILSIVYEKNEKLIESKDLAEKIYENSKDLKDTLSFESFIQNFQLISKNSHEIAKNPRTGKIASIVDHRK